MSVPGQLAQYLGTRRLRLAALQRSVADRHLRSQLLDLVVLRQESTARALNRSKQNTSTGLSAWEVSLSYAYAAMRTQAEG